MSNTHNGNVDGPLIQVGSLYGDINIHRTSDGGTSQGNQQYLSDTRSLEDHKAAASAAALLLTVREYYSDWPAPDRLPLMLGTTWQTLPESDPIRPWAEAIDSLRTLLREIEHQALRRHLAHVVEFLSVGPGCKRAFDWDQAFFLALAACDGGIGTCEAFVRYQPLPEPSVAAQFIKEVLEPSLRPLLEAAGRIIANSNFRSCFSTRSTHLTNSLGSAPIDIGALLKRKGQGSGPSRIRRHGRARESW